jgi:hypothetical protein
MEAQEIFDTVVRHLARQGRPSLKFDPQTGKPSGCVYRGPDKTMCAVGVLLHDDEYRPIFDLDGLSVFILFDRGYLPKRLHPHYSLLDDLQQAHDTGYVISYSRFNFPYLKEMLLTIAKDHHLDISVLNEMPEH